MITITMIATTTTKITTMMVLSFMDYYNLNEVDDALVGSHEDDDDDDNDDIDDDDVDVDIDDIDRNQGRETQRYSAVNVNEIM